MLSLVQADVKKRTEEGSKKERKENRVEITVPEAKGAVVAFVESRSVDITLVAATSSLSPVEFLIREAPKFGTLTHLRFDPKQNNRATVTYTHRGSSLNLQDRFVFACRVANGPISAPAVIELRGVLNSPKMEVLKQPLIRQTFLGTSSTAEFILRNAGTAPFVKELTWPKSFKGPSFIRVEPGAQYTGEITFSPKEEGTVREDLLLQFGHPASELKLVAEAARDLTVSPGLLQLEFEESTGKRIGMVTLVNRSEVPLKIEIQENPRLGAIEPLSVAPLDSVKVPLELKAEDTSDFESELLVSGGASSYVLKVKAEATPGKLAFAQLRAEVLDFGTLEHKAKKSLSVIVQNIGGQPLVASVVANPPFKLVADSDLLKLAPQKMKLLDIELEGVESGVVAGTLIVSTASQKLQLPLRGAVKQDPRMEEEIVNPNRHLAGTRDSGAGPKINPETGDRMLSRSEMLLHTILMTQGVPIPKERINANLPMIGELLAEKVTRKSLTISAALPSNPPGRYVVQTSKMVNVPDYPMPIKVWHIPAKISMRINLETQRVEATLEDLNAGSTYEIRILGLDDDNKFSKPGETIIVGTLSGYNINPWYWKVPLIAGLLYAIAFLRKKRLGLI